MEQIERPIDEYDLSALYLQIGLSFLMPHEQKIELLGRVAIQENQRLTRLCHVLREELSNNQGHMKNLENRIFALEQVKTKKQKSSYD